MHPVVNIIQVKKYHGSLQRPPPIEIDGEEEYEVEDILDHRISGRGYQYLVFWTGYDASENQWLLEQELQHCKKLSSNYKKCHKLAGT